jgi:hypothetical protein
LKEDASGRQTIDVRRLDHGVTVTTDARVQVIGDQEQNVLALIGLGRFSVLPVRRLVTEKQTKEETKNKDPPVEHH